MSHKFSRMISALMVMALLGAGCSTDDSEDAGTTTEAAAASDSDSNPIILSGQGNHLDAYSLLDGNPPDDNTADHQRVITNAGDDPNGLDINAQLCVFDVDGKRILIAGEDTGQPDPPAGWGIFELTGEMGTLTAEQQSKLTPTYQPGEDPENYGCGVLADGRILTTDVGEPVTGASGQLIIWFPPFVGSAEGEIAYCKLDIELPTAQSILVTGDEEFLVAAARGGVFRYSGPFPTGDTPQEGCSTVDTNGSPLAGSINKETVIEPGDNAMATPAGLAPAPKDGMYVSSVFTGVINEYDLDGTFRRQILAPAEGDIVDDEPYETGTPLGIATDSDGNLWYADIGLVLDDGGIGPGRNTGTLRVIQFVDDKPQAPLIVAEDLAFPDGVGTFKP